jgi:hypothetical protein
MFVFNKEDFEINPFLERDLRNIFKIINKEKNKKSIYDLKYYYLFFYNLYLEKKLILPIFYLNDKDIDIDIDETVKEEDKKEEDKKEENKEPILYFNSLYNRYNIEIFNGNNINLTYNTLIYNLKDNEVIIDSEIENQIKNQIIFYNLIKKYLKCNKITFLIMTELL